MNKYEEALALARQGKSIEEIFPELCESEDERIRKKMIEHFKSKTKDTWCNIPVKSILAYLEKQKEQKPKNILTENDTTRTAYCKGQTDVIEDPEKYGLCKPAEWSAYDKATIEYIIEDIKGLRDEETDEEAIETYDRELNLLQCINDSVKLCNYTNPVEWGGEKEKAVDDYATEIIKWEDNHKDWDREAIRATYC